MKAIIIEETYRSDRFEVVDFYPHGYTVWNIGREHFPIQGYIPLAEVDETCHVNTKTLKTIKCPNDKVADYILKVAGRKDVDQDEYYRIINEIHDYDNGTEDDEN